MISRSCLTRLTMFCSLLISLDSHKPCTIYATPSIFLVTETPTNCTGSTWCTEFGRQGERDISGKTQHFSLPILTRVSLRGQPRQQTVDRAVVYSRSGAISGLRTSRLPQNRFSLNLVLLRAINRPNKICLVKPVEIKCHYLFVCLCVCVLNVCHKITSKPENIINLLAMVQEFNFIYTSQYISLLELRPSKHFGSTLHTDFL